MLIGMVECENVWGWKPNEGTAQQRYFVGFPWQQRVFLECEINERLQLRAMGCIFQRWQRLMSLNAIGEDLGLLSSEFWAQGEMEFLMV